jgi:hypothetical protein
MAGEQNCLDHQHDHRHDHGHLDGLQVRSSWNQPLGTDLNSATVWR